jgi:hypothetical protein
MINESSSIADTIPRKTVYTGKDINETPQFIQISDEKGSKNLKSIKLSSSVKKGLRKYKSPPKAPSNSKKITKISKNRSNSQSGSISVVD